MAGEQRRQFAQKAKPIPIHLVSFGDGIPLADLALEDHRGGNSDVDSYNNCLGYKDVESAFTNERKPNVLFLNIAPSSYQEHLHGIGDYFIPHKPLIVAPLEYKEQIPNVLIAKYSIKFIPFYEANTFDFPERLENLLRERQQQTSPSL